MTGTILIPTKRFKRFAEKSGCGGNPAATACAVDAPIGIRPRDEFEGMIATAQLIAAHNAAMECYRRAMIGEQTFEGRRENLAQTNKLSPTPHCSKRSIDTVAKASRRSRWSTSRPFRRTGRGRRGRGAGGRESAENRGSSPCKANYPCTSADTAERGHRAVPVASDAQRPLSDARGPSPGAPKGMRTGTGAISAEEIARRREIAALVRSMRASAREVLD